MYSPNKTKPKDRHEREREKERESEREIEKERNRKREYYSGQLVPVRAWGLCGRGLLGLLGIRLAVTTLLSGFRAPVSQTHSEGPIRKPPVRCQRRVEDRFWPGPRGWKRSRGWRLSCNLAIGTRPASGSDDSRRIKVEGIFV